LFMFYMLDCFVVFRYKTESERKSIYASQNVLRIIIHFLAYFTLFLKDFDIKLLILFIIQEIVFSIVLLAYTRIYPSASRLIINNMLMLLTVGLIILTRLSYGKALRQFGIISFSLAFTFIIPYVIKKFSYFDRFQWIYVGFGLISLLAVLIFSNSVYGSKLNITIANYTFQPSEYVKVFFVFGIACLLKEKPDIKRILLCSGIAGAHVLLLVASKDLGSAVIFFIMYFAMLYVASKNLLYYLLSFVVGGVGAFAGYMIFPHVRNRIIAYTDPFGTIENQGYQIAQSLFAIGTGGWFGMGLGQGAPGTIPVVAADFIFSAITEELGVLFGICLILICLSCFIMFLNIAMRFKDMFYKLIAVGLAVGYGFQVFLTIGGVIKFIPLTGVTLPLVSYGGTSIVVTLVVFSIIQGLYITRGDNINTAYQKKTDSIEYANTASDYDVEELQTYNQEIPISNNNVETVYNEVKSDISDVTKIMPDEEDIMFEKAVQEGCKIAADDFYDFKVDNIDDLE